jgi:hypothetical protein
VRSCGVWAETLKGRKSRKKKGLPKSLRRRDFKTLKI